MAINAQHHMSATCGNQTVVHKDYATASNTMDGSNANKGWNSRT
jgi:hypothetical protein